MKLHKEKSKNIYYSDFYERISQFRIITKYSAIKDSGERWELELSIRILNEWKDYKYKTSIGSEKRVLEIAEELIKAHGVQN